MKKKILLAAAVIVPVVVVAVFLVLAALGYGIHLVRSLNTPEFKASVLEKAKEAAGTDVRVEELEISLFSGVRLQGVTIANPKPFPGDLLSAEAFVLHYRLMPLLRGRLEIQELSLKKPVINLASDAKGVFNYERLGGAPAAHAPTPPETAASETDRGIPLTLVLSRLAVEDARLMMTDAAKTTLIAVENADFTSSFEVTSDGAQGQGRAAIELVNMMDMLFLRNGMADLRIEPGVVRLAPLRAKLAGGEADADLVLQLKDFRYVMNIEAKGVDVKTLLAEAQSGGGVQGTLFSKSTFEGTGGMETVSGQGRAEIAECRLSNVKVLALLSALLQVPELADPDFDQCVVEFKVNGNRLSTPVISFKGAAVQITGKGAMNMESEALAYDLNLALASSMLNKIPVQETRAAFKERGDGFSAVDFRVYGTSDAPKTDLTARLARAAAAETARKGVKKLLKRKKLF
jgi:hypothetical protein